MKRTMIVGLLLAVGISASAHEAAGLAAPVAPETSLGEAVAAVSPLDVGAVVDWAYQQIKARGMLVYTASLKGDSAPGASLKVARWRPGGREVVSLTVGGDFGRDGLEERAIALDTVAWHVGAPVHLLNIAQPLLRAAAVQRNFDWIAMPAGIEPMVGPALVWPPGLALNQLRLDRDLRLYLSVGKKF